MSNFLKILTSRVTLLIGIVVLALMFLKQCQSTQDAKQEAQRHFNNLLAERDSVRILKSQNGNMLAEKSAFKLKYDELSKDQKELVKRLELEGKKKPSTIIQTEIAYRDTSIIVPVLATQEGDQTELNFSHKPSLPGKNKLIIEGKLPYSIKIDSVLESNGKYKYTSTIVPQNAKLSMEQTIDLVTGLYTDPKTGRLYVRASTTFPGITFSDMQALDMVDDPATKKALKQARKTFGLGLSVGYGLTLAKDGTFNAGPNIGLGLTYTPKFLQFGK